MLKKSLSDLSTTILSVKDSIISKNNESDSEQIEISALITSYNIVENPFIKLFKKKYILFEIKLYTPYKIWIINKRYSQFVQLKKQLESKNVKNLPKLPPKLIFMNEEKINERQLYLEEFLNELFKSVNILKYPIILDFIECPQDVIDILMYNMDCLNSSMVINTTMNDGNYYNGIISTNKNNIYNYDDINNNNFYCSIAQFQSNNINSSMDNNDSFESENSPGSLVIKEFLRNLMDISFNKTELLFQFEYFLLNKKNDEKRSNNDFNWYYLTENEIKIFFKGFYSNISHTKINGFLYHCGNINFNKIAAEQCLEFLKKLLSEDYNPQAEIFTKIFKRCNINDILQLDLERHIVENTNSVRINAFIVLYKYIEDEEDIDFIAKKILGDDNAEELFNKWYKAEY